MREHLVVGWLLGGLVGWSVLSAFAQGGPPVSIVTVARGAVSRVKEPLQAVVRTKQEWTALWARHMGPAAAPPPSVDFSLEMVIAVFAGERPTAGYDVEITRVLSTDSGIQVTYRERTPAAGALVRQVVTAPFHIIRLPRSEGSVQTKREGGP